MWATSPRLRLRCQGLWCWTRRPSDALATDPDGGKQKGLTSRQVIDRLFRGRWGEVHRKGGHKQFKPGEKPDLMTISTSGSKDLPSGTLDPIFRQVG